MLKLEDIKTFTLNVNGEKKSVILGPTDVLLDVLRDKLGLTGGKPGCENGDCGACTVLLDGVPIKSCLMLAVEAVDHEITTIEGLSNTVVQDAFVNEAGFQCGYCTSGFILNTFALLKEQPEADDAVITEWLEANICRCTGYDDIKNAVKLAQNNLR